MKVHFHRPPLAPDADGVAVDVSPANAGWTYLSMRVVAIGAGSTYEFATGSSEWIVLPLAGSARVSCEGRSLELEGRDSVFARVTDFAYVPRGRGRDGGQRRRGPPRLCGALAERTLPFRYGPAEEVPVELRGAGSASRQCNNFSAPDAFETDRLVSVEVLVPGGNWASYPPHKHDEAREGEAQLEEIYYFEVTGGAGAHTRVRGPTSASTPRAPGARLTFSPRSRPATSSSFLTATTARRWPAGLRRLLPQRAGRPRERAEHGILRRPDTRLGPRPWQDQTLDPRLPMTSYRGKP